MTLATEDGLIYRWSAAKADLPDLVGHVVGGPDGYVIFDPPAAAGLVEEIRTLGPVRAILLTGAHHDRAAGALRARLGMPPLLAPEEDVEELMGGGLLVDEGFGPGEVLGEWEAIRIPPSPPFEREWAFFRKGDGTLVLSDLIVFGATDRLYPDAFGVAMDPTDLKRHVKALADRGPIRAVAGHGDDVLTKAAHRLASLAGTTASLS